MARSTRLEWLAGFRRWVRFGGLDECTSDAERAGFNRAARANEMLETGNRPTSADAIGFCPYTFWSLTSVIENRKDGTVFFAAPSGAVEALSAKDAVAAFLGANLIGEIEEVPSPFTDNRTMAFRAVRREWDRQVETVVFVREPVQS